MRVFALVALALVLNYANGQPAAAQENFKTFEIDDSRLREIALAIAGEAKVDAPARLRDVMGVENRTTQLFCGQALVKEHLGYSMGYRPFAGYILQIDDTPPGDFTLVGYGFPIGPVDMGIYEQCERFGFRL